MKQAALVIPVCATPRPALERVPMFEYEFYDASFDSNTPVSAAIELPSNFLTFNHFATVRPTFWGEHCVECAMPLCFNVCVHYEARPDNKCKRFVYGIKDAHIPGLEAFPYRAQIQFKEWAKLESPIFPGVATPSAILDQNADYLNKADALLKRSAADAASVTKQDYEQIFGVGYVHGDAVIADDDLGKETEYFVFQTYSLSDQPFDMSFEVTTLQRLVTRVVFTVNPGFNEIVLPCPLSTSNFRNLVSSKDVLLARLIPLEDFPAHIVVLMAEFVNLTPEGKQYVNKMQESGAVCGAGESSVQGSSVGQAVSVAAEQAATSIDVPAQPAAKVKFVCWDLDNTVWNGTLIESDPDALELRPGVHNTMTELDRRGIVQMVVSKNQEEDAIPVLERLGINHLFVYRMINWNAKSNNIKLLAQLLNINVDTCAFIDDQPYERAEVSESLPCVRVYAETDVPALLEQDPFDVPVTKDASERRVMYQTEAQRKMHSLSGSGNNDDFVRSCNMELVVCLPTTTAQHERSYELVQRTNQLNLSGNRYEADDFMARIAGEQGARTVCLTCKDRFGSYGQVGYIVLELRNHVLYVREFAMSCRVMGKYVEHALAAWLCSVAKTNGAQTVMFVGKKTERNGILIKTLKQIGFMDRALFEGDIVLAMDVDAVPAKSDIVRVTDTTNGALNAASLTTTAYVKKEPTEALVFVPHQDDELFTCGPGITEACELYNGRVAVVLVTDGSMCETREFLRDGGSCEELNDKHCYDLSVEEYGRLRDVEFVECCTALGIQASAIVLPHNRVVDGQVTPQAARDVVEPYVQLYPDALVMTHCHIEPTDAMDQPSAFSADQLAYEHINPNNGTPLWWNQHPDHHNLGAAVDALVQEGVITHARFYVEFYHLRQFMAANPNVPLFEYVAAGNSYTRLCAAIHEYCVWDPEQQRYALGFHSAHEELKQLEDLATSYSYDEYCVDLQMSQANKDAALAVRQKALIASLQCEVFAQREQSKALTQQIADAQGRLDDLCSSSTYKVGRAIMALPCAIKDRSN